ncbi:MAG: tetratricopeptide repeat protein [Bacteroidota bacterium]
MVADKKKRNQQQNKPTIAPKSSSNEVYILGFIIFVFTFLLYSNTLQHKYVLDDFGALADNWIIKKGVSGIPIILKSSYRFGINMLTDNLYRPLSQVMFAVEWQISPKNPSLSHFVNVLFYALSCLLLFKVLRQYLSKFHYIIPFFITILFAVHPLHTEVVANIKSRDEIMSFFFLMLSLLALHKWFIKNNILNLTLAVVCYFLALMSKEGAVTMLAIFPLMGWYFTKANPKNIIISTALMIIPIVAYMAIRSHVLSQYAPTGAVSIVDSFLNATPDKASYFATAVMLLGKYLWLAFAPFQLVSDYSFNQIPIVGLSNWSFLLSFIIYLAAISWAVINIKKKSPMVFGILFFVVSMSIYSNIIMPIGSSFAERFMFLPLLGLCISIVFLLLRLFKLSIESSQIKTVQWMKSATGFVLIFSVVIIVFSAKTMVRASEWKDQYTLFSNDVKRSPNSAHMHFYWGLTLRDKAIEQSDLNVQKTMMLQAIEQFDKAASIYPLYPDCYEQLGLAWYRVKDPKKSMENYQKALALNNTKAVTWSNLGMIYFEQGDYLKSFELYSKALSLDSNYADGYFNMGSTLGMLGRFDEAITSFEKCIYFDPENAKAHQFIGITYQNLHRDAEAKPWFDKAAIIEQKKAREKKVK